MRGGNSQDRRRARRASERRFERAARSPQPISPLTAFDTAEIDALVEAAAAFESAACADCGHSFSDHMGAAGPCTYEDGRGTCSCTGYAAASKETGLLPEAMAMERFDEQFPTLFKSGDVIWTFGEGLVDLLADVNGHTSAANAQTVDVSVRLDKALIQTDAGLMAAAITISDDGAPVLAAAESWTPVGDQPDDPAAAMRLWLTDFSFASDTVTLPDEHQPGERIPKRNASPATPTPPAGASTGGPLQWTALFLPEGKLTDDGRAFAPGSVKWRDLPLSLMAMTETSAQGGHDGAEISGRIDQIWRQASEIRAAGIFDDGEFGQEIARMVADGVLRGLSVDTAIQEYEVGPRSDYFDEDGNWLDQKPEASEQDEPTLLDILFGDDDGDRIFVVTDAVIGMATVCPFPAFAEANIALVASGAVWRYTHQGGFITNVGKPEPIVASGFGETPAGAGSEEETAAPPAGSLTAGAAGLVPVQPPASWFDNPELEALTPLTVTEDGRIYGHAWSWDTCHIAFQDQCVLAPHSGTENSYFHLGEIECEDGETLAVGKITLDTGHAGPRASRQTALAHYDNTGTVAAHVRCGEDEFGGWIAGAVSPDLSEEKLRLLRGASLSGDWRGVRKADGSTNLELIALLAVNVPGFPIPRQPKALVAAGDAGLEALSLVAAGIVTERTPEEEDLAAVAALAASVDCGCGD